MHIYLYLLTTASHLPCPALSRPWWSPFARIQALPPLALIFQLNVPHMLAKFALFLTLLVVWTRAAPISSDMNQARELAKRPAVALQPEDCLDLPRRRDDVRREPGLLAKRPSIALQPEEFLLPPGED
ncbi:hypothetical protein FB45DRAFT_234338 [Roridomyces roridus]|uniref:Uncharacterized protein n=1 Tax=Roridomyces roridus TaxID=1738132 RepID=A0AAD7BAN1_9AGAR|nr:hypothetical protein FB45DRAFT_234338 [Roridomyces roridus]